MAEHLVQPAPAVRERASSAVGGARGGDRREDPAARGQDLEVVGALLAQDELALARAGEQQVRVRVDEARRDDPAGPHRGGRTGRAGSRSASSPASTGRAGPTAAIRPSQHATTGASAASGSADAPRQPATSPRRSPAEAAGQRRDLAPRRRSGGPGWRRVAPAALDDPEAAVTDPRATPRPGRSSRSSRACSRGEVAQSQERRGRGQRGARSGRSRRGAGAVRDGQEGRQRREADQLRLGQLDAVLGGDVADRLPDEPDGVDREVEQVHRDLRARPQLLDPEPVGLDPRQPAARLADPPGDPLGQLDVGPSRG